MNVASYKTFPSAGPETSLCESEEFLSLSPDRMGLLLHNTKTNCTETVLATALLKWAARAWDWYELVSPSNHHYGLVSPSNHQDDGPCGSGSGSSGSLNDSGIVLSEEYVLEIPREIFEIPSPPPAPPGGPSLKYS